MGVVYKARQQRLNRAVALKRLACRNGKQLARAGREAEMLARLQHPNIVQIFEVIEHEGRIYLALELVEGGPLSARLGGKPQSPQASAHLVEMLARAVHYAHLRGIVHRDLKPSNVLLAGRVEGAGKLSPATLHAPPSTRQWSGFLPKITDFGIAKQLTTEDGETRDGDVIGTPGYMAPEQAGERRARSVPPPMSTASASFSMKCSPAECRCSDLNVVETLLLVRQEEPVPPRRLAPHLPRDLETICLKCLHKEPNQRYASAEQLADDLHRFLSHEPIQALPTPAWERARKWVRRRPGITALAALVLLVAMLGFSLVAWQWRGRGQGGRRGPSPPTCPGSRATREGDPPASAKACRRHLAPRGIQPVRTWRDGARPVVDDPRPRVSRDRGR